MYSKVKLLRRQGDRRSDREIASDPGAIGHLALVRVAGVKQLTLYAPQDDALQRPVIPVLLNAELISMHGARMLFSGCNDPAKPDVVQEWAVEVMVEQPRRQA